MKYGEELAVITYKVTEIKEDLKALRDIEKRVTKVERFMYYCMGALSLVIGGIPVALFILKELIK